MTRVVSLVVILAAAAFAGWWFMLRDQGDPEHVTLAMSQLSNSAKADGGLSIHSDMTLTDSALDFEARSLGFTGTYSGGAESSSDLIPLAIESSALKTICEQEALKEALDSGWSIVITLTHSDGTVLAPATITSTSNC